MRLTVDESGAERRVDAWLAETLAADGSGGGLSRSGLKRLIDEGGVRVSGETAKPSRRLKAGETVELTLPEPVPLDVKPENIALEIVYEDDCLIVVNKPQGMVVHPAPGHYEGTLVNALLHHCREELSGINGALRPGIVHRIDRDTSGLLVSAKTDAAHRSLSEQLAAHSVTRLYQAIAIGRLDEAVTICQPIARHKTERKKMAVDHSGRRAVTHITPLRPLTGQGGITYSYLEARLETGRTHQIRVHMAFIRRPLLGDKLYGPEKQPRELVGQTLHAGVLGFRHPATGKYMEFTAEPPEYFKKLLTVLA